MFRPIAISLSPNTDTQDIRLALKLLFSPWSYLSGASIKTLEQWFRQYFSQSFAISFNSGRSSFLAILKALEIGQGDEVILQSFTCVAVPNAIIAQGAKPVYIDINSSLTLDVVDFKNKISKKTKAVLVQHTFGIPSNMTQIIKIAKEHNIKVIEDCAHTIGGTDKGLPAGRQGKKLGTFGDAAFFSFGRDKAFSSVFGGMAITNNKVLGEKLRVLQKNRPYPTRLWVAQQLFHPVAFSIILPFYNILSLGKLLLVFLQGMGLLSFPVLEKEKKGEVGVALEKLPNALAALAVLQLRRVAAINQKREQIVAYYLKHLSRLPIGIVYNDEAPLLRFAITSETRDEMLTYFRKKGIYLGTWYANVIDPKGTDMRKIMYQRGSTPMAEQISRQIINLPTYPAMQEEDVKRIIRLLRTYVSNKGN